MADFVVGEGNTKMEDVERTIKQSKSFKKLHKNWKQFSQDLGVRESELIRIMKVNQGTLRPDELIREILRCWKVDRGSDATLGVLCGALDKCGTQDISSLLRTLFSQNDVFTFDKKVTFQWQRQGKEMTLEELLRGNKTSQKTYKLIRDEIRKNLLPKSPCLLLKELFTPPEYYIPRTLLHFPSMDWTLDEKIFMSDSAKNHVFLFKGIEKLELTRLFKYEGIDSSVNQLKYLNARFILLECDEDFDKISAGARKPLHVIQCESGRYYWIKSSEGMVVIQQFLKSHGEPVEEMELASKMCTSTFQRSLAIAGSSGMGKSMLLANLASVIQEEEQQQGIALFVVLQEFVQQFNLADSSCSSVVETVLEYSSSNRITKLILTETLKIDTQMMYLFLDGYDEVAQDKLEALDSFLKHLQDLKNVKVIVSTRPHLKERLEKVLNQFAYEILPFPKKDKIHLIANYWIDRCEAKKCKELKDFAKKCVSALEANAKLKESEIAGIPLQCMMMAEVYGEEAMRMVSDRQMLRPEYDAVQPLSFFELYHRFFEIKFSRLQSETCNQNHLNFHVHEAINLLFPDWIETFLPFLRGWDNADQKSIHSLGLILRNEKVSRFVHRTFAEYLLAEFIVVNLRNHSLFADFLFRVILGQSQSQNENSQEEGTMYSYHEFNVDLKLPNELLHHCKRKFPVVTHFIEMHMGQHSIDDLLLPDYSKLELCNRRKDACMAVRTCCTNDLQNIFDYVSKVLHHYEIGKKLRNPYFKDLPHAVVECSNEVKMLEKVLKFTREEFNFELGQHELPYFGLVEWNIPNYTPLHVAVSQGKYNFATHLVQEYGEEHVQNMDNLLHVCVHRSKDESEAVIEDKLSIFDMLVRSNPSWINESMKKVNRTPLLQKHVHFRLLQRLVEHGADVNALSDFNETVLHMAWDRSTYSDLVHLVFSNGFHLINLKNSNRRTPLMYAIEKFGTLEDRVLELFHGKAADFNAKDSHGNSVLFYALQYSGNIDFIRKLQTLGAEVNHKNMGKQNPIHKVLEGRGSIEQRLLVIDMLVCINPGWVNDKDGVGFPPLLQKYADFRLLQRLVEHGADINVSSRFGTVLHKSFRKSNYADVVSWAFQNGFVHVNYRLNEFGRTPLMHAIVEHGTVEDEVLWMYSEVGADFNAVDNFGESVLFLALRHSDSVDFIRKLVRYGADVNYVDKSGGWNAAHEVMQGKLDSKGILDVLKFLLYKEFNQFNQKDSLGRTPLDLAVKFGKSDAELVAFLNLFKSSKK